jgi:hypothetical protein
VTVPVALDDDLEKAADTLRPALGLYVGGLGAKEANFHCDALCRLGFEAEAFKIQQLFTAGHQKKAIAAVLTAMVEAIALIGPKEKIRDDRAVWRESAVTTILIQGNADLLRAMAESVLGCGRESDSVPSRVKPGRGLHSARRLAGFDIPTQPCTAIVSALSARAFGPARREVGTPSASAASEPFASPPTCGTREPVTRRGTYALPLRGNQFREQHDPSAPSTSSRVHVAYGRSAHSRA